MNFRIDSKHYTFFAYWASEISNVVYQNRIFNLLEAFFKRYIVDWHLCWRTPADSFADNWVWRQGELQRLAFSNYRDLTMKWDKRGKHFCHWFWCFDESLKNTYWVSGRIIWKQNLETCIWNLSNLFKYFFGSSQTFWWIKFSRKWQIFRENINKFIKENWNCRKNNFSSENVRKVLWIRKNGLLRMFESANWWLSNCHFLCTRALFKTLRPLLCGHYTACCTLSVSFIKRTLITTCRGYFLQKEKQLYLMECFYLLLTIWQQKIKRIKDPWIFEAKNSYRFL